MELRPYQQEARQAVENEWACGVDRTLLVLPTGCGKTIVFAKIAEDSVRDGDRVLILAHRGELLEQAADKIRTATGLLCATEKAQESCLGSWYRIVVGSVQTLMREKRLAGFDYDYFDKIIIDEAHHCISDSYRRVLDHFSTAKVLGVTATPDRGDMKNLGAVFQSLAYEYKQELVNAYQSYVDEMKQKGADEYTARDNLQKQLLDIEERYTDRIASTNNRRAANLDEATQKQIATLLEMVEESGSAYDDLDSTTQQMVDGFMENIDRLSPETKDSLNDTLKGMGMTIDSNGKLLYTSGEKSGQEVIKGWKSKIPTMQSAADEAIKEIDSRMKSGKVSAPSMGNIGNAYNAAANARAQIQSYLNNNPVYATVRTSHAAGGYWARGGGMTPEIHKHAAGVFTKRTRLWDPVTGINEYGEAGHEALLPLKTSVYDEIAKGIVRQLSPAKLSGIVDMLRSAVRERNETVTVQVQERRDLRAAEKATLHEEDSGVEELREEVAVLGSRMEQVLTLLKEMLGTSKSGANALLQALLGMRIDLDGEAVGRLIAPEINERLNDLYELEERGRF